MSDILNKFISCAKQNMKNGYYDNIKENTIKRISLQKTLLSKNFSLISEIKHASPSGEYPFKKIDAEKTAISFRKAGADAISCVTEPTIFRGNLKNIPLAKKSGLPVLFKDFIFTEKQLNAASLSGADCVLLVLKVLKRTNTNTNKLIKIAHSYGLEVLLECYTKKEMHQATKTNADILGINNRNLTTRKVDLNRTKKIMHSISTKNLNTPIISESGIRKKADALFIKNCGVKGILVGTALWKTKNPEKKIKELKQ
jgi:indole-3-glycerol phosphate synthase